MMLIHGLILFLAMALVVYIILGGADFGTGLMELGAGKLSADVRVITKNALGPVWEANHMWLIIAVVIMFVGFPEAYVLISTYYHIPLTLLLIGIVLRGCAFTFRHYDTASEAMNRWYSRLFICGSLLSPLMFGMMISGLLFGKTNLHPTSFYEGYMAPWASVFSFLVGILAVLIFGYLSAVFCVGEADTHRELLENPAQIRKYFRRAAVRLAGAMILCGMLVLIAGMQLGTPLHLMLIQSPITLVLMIVATMALILSLASLLLRRYMLARVLAGGAIAGVVLGWIWVRFPTVMETTTGPISLYSVAAPAATLKLLLGALVCGSVLIFPGLYYLFKVFKL